MAITVPLTRLGLLRATDVLQSARNDAARRPETGPRTVSVDVGAPMDPGGSGQPTGQTRIVDVRV